MPEAVILPVTRRTDAVVASGGRQEKDMSVIHMDEICSDELSLRELDEANGGSCAY